MSNDWQTCPNCEGAGKSKMQLNTACPSCAGKGIINQATGLPPTESPRYEPIIIDHLNEQWVPPWHPSKQPYLNPYPIVTSVESG